MAENAFVQEALAGQTAADALAGRICAAAAFSAQSECQLLELIGEFDAIGGIGYWQDVKSLAHWLAWTCSMALGAAREHVRVARGLRQMPTVQQMFAAGELSYSKVRELTRLAGLVDEARFCQLAKTATASQLARMVSAYRRSDGSRTATERKRGLSWHTREEDGMVEFRCCLPADEGAMVIAALTAAQDQFGTPPERDSLPANDPDQADTTPLYTQADALLDVARVFLDTAPEDRSGEDRSTVVVHVSAELLADGGAEDESVPAGTSDDADVDDGGAPPVDQDGADVPAGTPNVLSGNVCFVEGAGAVEPETARRHACDRPLLAAVVDGAGQVLALGRTRRLVSQAQRRALMILDQAVCQFAGCAQTRHLDAHHIVPWAAGGPTDVGNLILLCGRHHTAVHEGGMRIEPDRDRGWGWRFVMPDGQPLYPWYRAAALPELLRQAQERARRDQQQALARIGSWRDPAAQKIWPGWAGERFDLGECVRVLFDLRLPDPVSSEALAA